MRLSGDYTSVRTAVLTADAIKKIADRYFLYFGQPGITSDPSEMIRELNQLVHKEIPGKEDLVTEWIFSSVLQWEGKYPEDISEFIEKAKFFFEHNKEARFKQAVEAVNKVSSLSMNPRNLLDFPLLKLGWVRSEYNALIDDPKVNKLTVAMPTGSKLFYNGHGYQIYRVTNLSAVCSLSQGTSWCTKRPEMASEYLSKGPLYLIYRKAFSYGLLFIAESDMSLVQLMDHDNEPIMVIDENLRQALIDSGLMDEILSGNGYMDESDFKRFVGNKPSAYFEKLCERGPDLAYFYALHVLRTRFPKGEPEIALYPEMSLWYARDVIKGRFKEAESTIRKYEHYWNLYTKMLDSVNPEDFEELVYEVKQGRWE